MLCQVLTCGSQTGTASAITVTVNFLLP